MNSTEFRAIRQLQKEQGVDDEGAAVFLDLVNAGHSESAALWDLAVAKQEEREDDWKHLAFDIARDEAKRRHSHELEVPF